MCGEVNPRATHISQVKRVKRETAPTSESAQFILAWRSEDSVEKREKQPRRGSARQWQQRYSRSGTKAAAAVKPGARAVSEDTLNLTNFKKGEIQRESIEATRWDSN